MVKIASDIKNLMYPVAGLDFIFDKNFEPWFIETNSASTLHKEFEEIYGYPITLKRIAKYIEQFKPNNLCCFVRKKHKFKKEKENGAWISHRMKEFFPQAYLCYMEDNLRVNRGAVVNQNLQIIKKYNLKNKRKRKVINSQGKKISPDFILRNYFQLKHYFENKGIPIINTMAVRDLVWFKNVTYEIVKNINGVNIPPYFIVNTRQEIKKILKEKKDIFKKGYVLKPINGSLGARVFISRKRNYLPNNIHLKKTQTYLLQKRIDVPLIKRKYWDTRSFVINEKFVGGVKRTSKKMVTNVSLGAKGEELEKDLQKKIKKPALKIIQAIEARARQKMKYSFNKRVKLLKESNFKFSEE